MREGLFILLIFFISKSSYGYDFPSTGNGSDGPCTFSSTDSNISSNTWNCTELTVSATISRNYTSPYTTLTFMVQGDVYISTSGSIELNGKGYTSDSGPSDGTYAITPNDIGGLGAGQGGGGGGGSHHNGNHPPTSGSAPTSGIGGEAGAAATTSYGSEAMFDFAIYAGAGGATGQEGTDFGIGEDGAEGGAGGGVIKIIAGGDIIVDGSILSNGKDGNDTVNLGGAGGGGAGGSVYLQAKGDIIINGSITAIGGTGGTATGGGGNGGDGAYGRIRLDDYDGVIENNGTITPSPYTKGVNTDNIYRGTLTCGTTSDTDDRTNLISFILGLLLIIFLSCLINKRPAKIQAL